MTLKSPDFLSLLISLPILTVLRLILSSFITLNKMTFLSSFILDECARGEDTCSINAFCQDTTDSYVCTCRTGYQGNGEVCDSK